MDAGVAGGEDGEVLTEAQWLAAEDPRGMLELLPRRASARKLRLLAVALVRPFEALLVEEASRTALEAAERLADGERLRPGQTLEKVRAAAWGVLGSGRLGDGAKVIAARAAARTVEAGAGLAARYAINEVVALGAEWAEERAEGRKTPERAEAAYWAGRAEGERRAAETVRELFGNPFRAAVADAGLRDRRVVDLARAVYDARAFRAMGGIADALEGAGCADAEVLGHCRGVRGHVRGCWVLDLILGMA